MTGIYLALFSQSGLWVGDVSACVHGGGGGGMRLEEMGKGLGACEEVSGQLGVQVLKCSPFCGSCRRAEGSLTLGKFLWVDPGDTLVDKKEERGRHLGSWKRLDPHLFLPSPEVDGVGEGAR